MEASLIPTEPTVCPGCGEPYELIVWAEPALLRHAGHGHTRAHTVRTCRCGTSIHDIGTVAPERCCA